MHVLSEAVLHGSVQHVPASEGDRVRERGRRICRFTAENRRPPKAGTATATGAPPGRKVVRSSTTSAITALGG